MNRKIKNLYIAFISLIILILFLFIRSYQTIHKGDSVDSEKSFKESKLQGTYIENLDSASMIYSNYKYGFAMDFPDNWSFDRGVSEHTIIRAVQYDSTISYSINVIELKDMKSDVDIWTVWDNDFKGLEVNYKNMITKMVNTDIFNFSMRKVNISNRKAIEIQFSYLLKAVDVEQDMKSLFYQIYKLPFVYTIGLHVPEAYYNLNPERYTYMINNFVFIK